LLHVGRIQSKIIYFIILSIKVTDTLIQLDYESDIAEFGSKIRRLKSV